MAGCDQDILHDRRIEKKKREKKWQAVRHSLGPKATPFCTLHVPIFVPKMDRDLLIHFREEQMPSASQDKRKEFQGRDTYTTQRYFFFE